MLSIVKAAPHAAVLVDECYFEFMGEDSTMVGEVRRPPSNCLSREVALMLLGTPVHPCHLYAHCAAPCDSGRTRRHVLSAQSVVLRLMTIQTSILTGCTQQACSFSITLLRSQRIPIFS